MCDYFAFRDKARAMFPGLIISVMMFEQGSGKGGEVTMYRVKAAGMSIGSDLSAQGANDEEVLTAMVRKVGAARRAKKAADNARDVARRAGAVKPQTPTCLVATAGGKAALAAQVPELAMAA